MPKALTFLLSAAVISGCYSHTSIKPTELPKLNGAGADLHSAGSSDVYVVSRGHVEAPDGRIVEIDGKFDAVVTTTNGAESDFEYPVIASANEAALTVAGSNRAPTDFQLGQIRDVSIEQWSKWNIAWVLPTILVVTGGGLILTMAAVTD